MPRTLLLDFKLNFGLINKLVPFMPETQLERNNDNALHMLIRHCPHEGLLSRVADCQAAAVKVHWQYSQLKYYS